jgi:hypothetical protein
MLVPLIGWFSFADKGKDIASITLDERAIATPFLYLFQHGIRGTL